MSLKTFLEKILPRPKKEKPTETEKAVNILLAVSAKSSVLAAHFALHAHLDEGQRMMPQTLVSYENMENVLDFGLKTFAKSPLEKRENEPSIENELRDGLRSDVSRNG